MKKIKIEKKYYLFIIAFIILITAVVYITGIKEDIALDIAPDVVPLESEVDIFKPGLIGEDGVNKNKLPEIIFDTSGVIQEIKSDRLLVQGSGSNFADQKPRTLILIFTDRTATLNTDTNMKCIGSEGLSCFEAGMMVDIKGMENIRGKTEFKIEHIVAVNKKQGLF